LFLFEKSNYFLQKSSSISETGGIVWQLVIALFCAWVITYICIFRGIKSSGKIVYFTALFPYVVLITLGVRGWMLPGASKGIQFYITPDLSKLANMNVWFDGAIQIFYSLGVSHGGLLTMASYNKFKANTIRDSLIVAFTNAGTSVFAGFVVFAYIGHAAHITQQEVADTVTSGTGLAFIVYPFAVTQLPGAPFWAVIFFLMLLTLGLDSEFAMVEVFITSILDVLPKYRRHKHYFILVSCLLLFAAGILMTTRSGIYWLDLFDNYSSGFAILTLGILECVCIGWVYGFDNFSKDIALMLGPQFIKSFMYWYFYFTWKFLAPISCLGLIIFSFIKYEPLQYNNKDAPFWSSEFGWFITSSITMAMIIFMSFDFWNALIKKTGISNLFKPSLKWGPLLLENQKLAVHLDNLKYIHGDSSLQIVATTK
jgi:solute carrier family 6 (neurotransmitter transporter, glycine) member 5/9